jgi:hypothetical protein
MLENIVNLRTRINDDRVDSEKEMKYLAKVEKMLSGNIINSKIKKILSKEPIYYDSDEDTETDWEFTEKTDDEDEYKCDTKLYSEMVSKAEDELKIIRFAKGMTIIKNIVDF